MKKIPSVVVVSLMILIIGCASNPTPIKQEYNLDAFAKCLTEKGIREYGSMTCSACASTKKMFGSSMQFIDYVECHPNGPNTQIDLCLKRNIKKTPAWILEKDGEEVTRAEGFKTLEELSEFSGCSLA